MLPVAACGSPGDKMASIALEKSRHCACTLAEAAPGKKSIRRITDLQCQGDCATPDAIGALVGALIGAGGVAVVVVLALRAMGEWRTVQRRPTGPERPASPQSNRPRVR